MPLSGKLTVGYHADREMRLQHDMAERGRRLRAAKAIREANVCDGLTLTRAVEGFSWARTAGDNLPAHTQSIAPNPGNAHGGRHSE